MGVRVYPDGRNPKDKTSLAVARRLARQQRRRRDRYIKRRARLMEKLIQHGLMPPTQVDQKSLEVLDPYALRAKGLVEALPLHHFGRALFHLNQRRGFKSNRKIDKADEKETSKIKSAISGLRTSMQENNIRTVGQYLFSRRQAGHPVRARLQGEGVGAKYDLYLDRSMIAEEFDALWSEQERFHPELLSKDSRDELREIILHQRPLRPVDPGRCTFEPDDKRAPEALPLAQQFRIYQELANMRLSDGPLQQRALTREERDRLAEALQTRPKLTFDQMRRMLRLSADVRFNLESEKRKDLKGNPTNMAMSRDSGLGDVWLTLSLETQTSIVEELLAIQEDSILIQRLQDQWLLSAAQAQRVALVKLPDGYGRIGRLALAKIVPHLRDDVIMYDEAARRAGYNHASFYTGEIFERLPYYGEVLQRHVAFGSNNPADIVEKRYGKIANPTVHIGMNQLRKLVNAIIERYGLPTQVIIEVTRELKQSRAQRESIEKEQARNQARNDGYRKQLADLSLPDKSENRLRLRLWEEANTNDPLNRRCPYSGEVISIQRLFSPEVEIEHILPFARTFDDSIANKVVCLRSANRGKGNNTPYEAFSSSSELWEGIVERAALLPANKSWRFAQDAMERYSKDSDFLARHLNDTAYLSRIAREYLTAVCNPNHVWAIPGRLTSLIRARWGLNSLLSDSGQKERKDHRHHAVDALVVALTDRAMLQRISSAAARAKNEHMQRLLEDMPEPWNNFRDTAAAALDRITVSYKPDHGVQGSLHNDTAYGIIEGPNKEGAYEVVHRKPLVVLKNAEELQAVRDKTLRAQLLDATKELEGKAFKVVLADFSTRTGVRRVRLTESLNVIPIGNPESPYKAYKGDGNYCYEIFANDEGVWDGNLITRFEANQRPYHDFQMNRAHYLKNSFCGRRLQMRLCKNDFIAIEGDDGHRRVMVVVKFSVGRIVFAEHIETGNLKSRDSDKDDPFKYLTKSPNALHGLRSRRVLVDILGHVLDPGFHDDRESR